MDKRTMDELIFYFNQEVSKMEISQENKMKLLGMITAIGYENKKQEVVRCRECRWGHLCVMGQHLGLDGFCSKGEREVQDG